MTTKLKLVARTSNRPEMLYRALIIYRKKGVTAQRQRSYSTRARAIVGAMAWMIRDGQVNTKVMIYHAVTSQEVAVVKMGALGNIHTVFPWGPERME